MMPVPNATTIRAYRDFSTLNGFGIYGWKDERNSLWRITGLTMECVTPENEVVASPPFLRLNETTAQVLMDSLWECGIRPTDGAGSAGAMAATERHLKDMQTIAFDLLNRKSGRRSAPALP